ncbi:MAG: OmpH family outer membrane protein [Deltaproteobacteria bacterium]|nr:OmpH family outer membrane protein [Deltaproteobacteria bacterium]
MKKKGLLLGLTLFAFILSAVSVRAADVKIGYANLQKALNECDAGIKAKDTLKDEAKKLEDELNVKQEELKKMKDELDKKASVWNKETREAKEKEFKTKSQDFQQKFMDYGEQLNKRKQDVEAQIIEDLRDVVEEIAKKKNFTYVFEKSVGGLLYAPSDADLTDEVIKVYNKRTKSK